MSNADRSAALHSPLLTSIDPSCACGVLAACTVLELPAGIRGGRVRNPG
jgi:hypothetical protein